MDRSRQYFKGKTRKLSRFWDLLNLKFQVESFLAITDDHSRITYENTILEISPISTKMELSCEFDKSVQLEVRPKTFLKQFNPSPTIFYLEI